MSTGWTTPRATSRARSGPRTRSTGCPAASARCGCAARCCTTLCGAQRPQGEYSWHDARAPAGAGAEAKADVPAGLPFAHCRVPGELRNLNQLSTFKDCDKQAVLREVAAKVSGSPRHERSLATSGPSPRAVPHRPARAADLDRHLQRRRARGALLAPRRGLALKAKVCVHSGRRCCRASCC
jgi:hypothetical protein